MKLNDNKFENNNIENIYVKSVYENIANHFDNTRAYTWPWIDEFLNNLEPYSNVYDIGCGNGRNMLKKNLHFIGVDNCENFVKICHKKNLSVINANMTKIPLQNNSADAIICIAVLHHLASEKSRIDALLEMKRLIKKKWKNLVINMVN